MKLEIGDCVDLLRTRHIKHVTYYFRLKTKCFHIIDIGKITVLKNRNGEPTTRKITYSFDTSSFEESFVGVQDGFNLSEHDIIFYNRSKEYGVKVAQLRGNLRPKNDYLLSLKNVRQKIIEYENTKYCWDL